MATEIKPRSITPEEVKSLVNGDPVFYDEDMYCRSPSGGIGCEIIAKLQGATENGTNVNIGKISDFDIFSVKLVYNMICRKDGSVFYSIDQWQKINPFKLYRIFSFCISVFYAASTEISEQIEKN